MPCGSTSDCLSSEASCGGRAWISTGWRLRGYLLGQLERVASSPRRSQRHLDRPSGISRRQTGFAYLLPASVPWIDAHGSIDDGSSARSVCRITTPCGLGWRRSGSRSPAATRARCCGCAANPAAHKAPGRLGGAGSGRWLAPLLRRRRRLTPLLVVAGSPEAR